MEYQELPKAKENRYKKQIGEALKHKAAVEAVYYFMSTYPEGSVFQNAHKYQDLKKINLWGPILLETPVLIDGRTLPAFCLGKGKKRISKFALEDYLGFLRRPNLCKALNYLDFRFCKNRTKVFNRQCPHFQEYLTQNKVRIPDITICDENFNARVILEFVNKHDLTHDKLRFYNQIPTLKLLCKFDVEKVLYTNPYEWSKVVVHRMTWYNDFVWDGKPSGD